MTVVAIWVEPNDDALWSIADTRIGVPGNAGGTVVRTDSGAKLFTLPIACHQFSPDPSVRRIPHYTASVGFAFSGDVLPATMTFATASTFLQNLHTSDSKNPPLLRDIARLICSLAERFSKESLSSSNRRYGKFEAAIFGFCPHLQRFAVYHLAPNVGDSAFSVGFREILPTNESEIVVLGSGQTRFFDKMALIRTNGDKFQRSVRIPKLAVEAMIEEDQGDVGGRLSIGIASRWKYDLYSWARPVEYGKPEAILSFNGINLAELGNVGHYIIAPNGMV